MKIKAPSHTICVSGEEINKEDLREERGSVNFFEKRDNYSEKELFFFIFPSISLEIHSLKDIVLDFRVSRKDDNHIDCIISVKKGRISGLSYDNGGRIMFSHLELDMDGDMSIFTFGMWSRLRVLIKKGG